MLTSVASVRRATKVSAPRNAARTVSHAKGKALRLGWPVARAIPSASEAPAWAAVHLPVAT